MVSNSRILATLFEYLAIIITNQLSRYNYCKIGLRTRTCMTSLTYCCIMSMSPQSLNSSTLTISLFRSNMTFSLRSPRCVSPGRYSHFYWHVSCGTSKDGYRYVWLHEYRESLWNQSTKEILKISQKSLFSDLASLILPRFHRLLRISGQFSKASLVLFDSALLRLRWKYSGLKESVDVLLPPKCFFVTCEGDIIFE